MNALPSANKTELRRHALITRANMTTAERERQSALIRAHLIEELLARSISRIAAYSPFDTEPGGSGFIRVLADLPIQVLLPVWDQPTSAPDWAWFDSQKQYGQVYAPSSHHLGANALAEVELVIVPALAVDIHGGRLGRGAGWYDRALQYTAAPAVALLFDGELSTSTLPTQPHDRPVSAVITSSEGWRELGLALA